MNQTQPVFERQKMIRFLNQHDGARQIFFSAYHAKHGSFERDMLIFFNTEILEDSVCEREYSRA